MLTDLFMEDDLCARCGVAEPLTKHKVDAEDQHGNRALLFFCSALCKRRFLAAYAALQEFDFSA